MKQYALLFVTVLIFGGCSTLGFGGSAETSATYVSKSSAASASSSSTSSSKSQSEIDMKVQDIRNQQNSKIVNKYIREGF